MTAKKPQVKQFRDIIVVAGKEFQKYEHAILLALTNFDKIKIQVTMGNLMNAEYLIKLFKNLGLEEINRERKAIKVVPADGRSYELNNAYEITLELVPALRKK